MAKSPTFVIIGASTAGVSAAVTLRREGFDGRIILLGEEKELPYARPPLSKEYLQRERGLEHLFFWPETFYSDLEIEVRTGFKASRVIPGEKKVELDGGERLAFDRLLLATGMEPRRLSLPGTDLPRVFYLRTLQDSDRIAEACKPGSKAVIVGGGFIGMEVASSLREREVEVAIIHLEKVALSHAIGEETGKILTEYHKDQGVEFWPEASISSIEGKEKAERVTLKSGKKIECDNVVIGVGVIPRTEIVEGTSIKIDKGIMVDEFCQTSVKDVFAAGDVTRFHHPGLKKHIHIEHWENARLHGIAAARNMLGKRIPYTPVPFFWSDQYDLNIQYVGFPLPWNKVVFKGDVDEHSFSAFLLDDRNLVAAVCFRRWRDRRACERLIQKGVEIDPEKLSDESYDLEAIGAAIR